MRIASIPPGPPVMLRFLSSSNRLSTLHYTTDLTDAPWTAAPGQPEVWRNGGLLKLSYSSAAPPRFYRVSVRRL